VDSPLLFNMYQPKGRLSGFVQGVWTASVASESSKPVERWLHSDACSGIIFNFYGDIYLDNARLAPGVVLLPISKQAHKVTLLPGAQLAGLRFHPAIGFSVFGTVFEEPTVLQNSNDDPLLLLPLYAKLSNIEGSYAQMVMIYRWLDKLIDCLSVLPESLSRAINALQCKKSPGQLSDLVPISQRQLERLFKQWMDMSPKQYQRILRVRNTFNVLKDNSNISLAELALSNGFSDQAHMTRESKQIAKITPAQYCKQVVLRD